jgi:hypothetical protein
MELLSQELIRTKFWMFEDSFRRPGETFLPKEERMGDNAIECHGAPP